MKTVIPEYAEPSPYHDRMDFIFHHGQAVSISRQVRPISQTTNMYNSIQQKDRMTEMEYIVIRFPKHLKPDYSSDLYLSLRAVFYHEWINAGDDVELLLHEGNMTRVLWELEKEGVFRMDMKVYADASQGLYLPHYRNPSRFWQKCLNVVTVTLSIPQAMGMLVKEVYDDRKKSEK